MVPQKRDLIQPKHTVCTHAAAAADLVWNESTLCQNAIDLARRRLPRPGTGALAVRYYSYIPPNPAYKCHIIAATA